jgi:hypothetical protein
LQFDIITHTLEDSIAALRRLGYGITLPPAAHPMEAKIYSYHKGKRYNSATGLEAPYTQAERDESAQLNNTAPIAPTPVTAEVSAPDRPLWSVPDEPEAGN